MGGLLVWGVHRTAGARAQSGGAVGLAGCARSGRRAFARALGIKCPIYGVALADRGYTAGTLAYIEFRKVGGSCIILVQPWNKGDATTAPRQPNRNHARRLGKNTNRTDVVSHGAMHGRLASRVTPARLA